MAIGDFHATPALPSLEEPPVLTEGNSCTDDMKILKDQLSKSPFCLESCSCVGYDIHIQCSTSVQINFCLKSKAKICQFSKIHVCCFLLHNPDIVVKWLSLTFCFVEAPGCNLGPVTCNRNWCFNGPLLGRCEYLRFGHNHVHILASLLYIYLLPYYLSRVL